MKRKVTRKKRRRRSRGWGWLALLGLGAVAMLLLKPSSPKSSSRRSRPTPPQRPLDDLPEDAHLSWVAAPSGSLRLCERPGNGDDQVVLFIHGLGGRLEHWAAQVRNLGPMRHAVAFDLPGHGESDEVGDDDYSISGLSAAISAVADALRLRRFVLVGHSFGALVAIEYARQHPERVAGLMLVDPNGDGSRALDSENERFLEALRDDPRGELGWHFRQILAGSTPEARALVERDFEATPEGVLAATAEATVRHSPLQGLECYTGPLVSVITEFNEAPQSLHNLLPELPVRRFFDCSHWLMLDKPDEFGLVLESFLEEVRGRLRPATVH